MKYTDEEKIIKSIVNYSKKNMSNAIQLAGSILIFLVKVSANKSADIEGDGSDKKISMQIGERVITIHAVGEQIKGDGL